MTDVTQLIPSLSIEALLAHREAIFERTQRIEDLLKEIQGISAVQEAIFFPHVYVYDPQLRLEYDTATVMKYVDRSLWQHLLHKSGLWTFMDAKAREEWQESYDKFKLPEMTRENVEAAFETLHKQRGQFIARGVDELFRRLSRHHATNSSRAFTPTIIIGYACDVWGTSRKWLCVNHRFSDEMDDLNRVTHVLRGLVEPEHQVRNAWSLLNQAKDSTPMVADFPFFTVKLFKKGTGHVIFKFEEDVARLNKVLSIYSNGVALAPESR